MQLHIIYIDTGVLLSKRPYQSWQEIQDEYKNYKASLGPWEADDVIDFLEGEYPNLSPSAREQVNAFKSLTAEEILLNFQS